MKDTYPADDLDRLVRMFEEHRPALHRFCSRMMGNPWDGEDVLQEVMAIAVAGAGELREPAAGRGWLFRIAHNKCIDALRVARRFEPLEDDVEIVPATDAALDASARTARALAHIVTELPAKERACIVLKDVLDYSLEETADITGSNIGAVKAALHRGRAKLVASEAAPIAMEPARRAIVERYLAMFNQRDWAGVRALLTADAHLQVVSVTEGPIVDACYFQNHEKLPVPWRLGLAFVDGVEAIVHYRDGRPHAVVQLELRDGLIARIRDYLHVEDLLAQSHVE